MMPACAFEPRGSLRLVLCAKLIGPFLAIRYPSVAVRIFLHVPGQAPARLIWTDKHPDSVAGCGVLRFKNRSERLDLRSFRELRDVHGAVIMTNHLGRVVRALGVPTDEPGIVEVDHGDA